MLRTQLTAHSGCDGMKDNYMEFVSYALGLDVDAIEVDVRKSSEGMLVLAHNDGPASATLRDVLLKLKEHPEKKLNCDLKQDNLELDVWKLAKQAGAGKQIIFSGTVSGDAAKLEPDLYKHVDWFVNIELLFPEIQALGFAEAVSMLGHMYMADKMKEFITGNTARCVNTHHSIASTLLYGELMKRGIPISVWTPNDEQVILRFLEDGVYNITTRNVKSTCGIVQGRYNL
jgi:glycerophosphoryl diester phosphodiesterase